MADSITPPIFTLEAANSLVPKLNVLVGEQMTKRAGIEAKLKDLTDIFGSVPDSITIDDDDSPELTAIKHELVARVDDYQRGWRELESLGAVLKDARVGLIDLYGHVDGKLVWLCWKYGEAEITHYHALDEGYSARRAIAPDIRQRHLN